MTKLHLGDGITLPIELMIQKTQRGEQSPTSSGFEKNVSTLKSYGLIDGGRGTGYVALQHLFLEAGVR